MNYFSFKTILSVAIVPIMLSCNNNSKSETGQALLNEDVTEKVMNSIIKEMKLFFGTGDYLTYEQGVARINASNHDKVTRDKMVIVYAFLSVESIFLAFAF